MYALCAPVLYYVRIGDVIQRHWLTHIYKRIVHSCTVEKRYYLSGKLPAGILTTHESCTINEFFGLILSFSILISIIGTI